MLLVLEGLIAAGVILGVALLGASLVRLALNIVHRHRQSRQPWHVKKRSAGVDHVVVEVVRPGQESQEIAVIDTGDDDFDMQLYEAEAKARNVALALNGR